MKAIFSILAFSFVLVGCSKPLQIAKSDSELGKASTKDIKSIRHYVGGFYPPPNHPGWSHDTTITLQPNGGALVKGKDFDPLCFKSGSLTVAQVDELEALLAGLHIVQSDGMNGIDAGIETVEVTWVNGGTSKIHLMDMEVPVGEYVANDGTELSTRLKDIAANLATGCQ